MNSHFPFRKLLRKCTTMLSSSSSSSFLSQDLYECLHYKNSLECHGDVVQAEGRQLRKLLILRSDHVFWSVGNPTDITPLDPCKEDLLYRQSLPQIMLWGVGWGTQSLSSFRNDFWSSQIKFECSDNNNWIKQIIKGGFSYLEINKQPWLMD